MPAIVETTLYVLLFILFTLGMGGIMFFGWILVTKALGPFRKLKAHTVDQYAALIMNEILIRFIKIGIILGPAWLLSAIYLAVLTAFICDYPFEETCPTWLLQLEHYSNTFLSPELLYNPKGWVFFLIPLLLTYLLDYLSNLVDKRR